MAKGVYRVPYEMTVRFQFGDDVAFAGQPRLTDLWVQRNDNNVKQQELARIHPAMFDVTVTVASPGGFSKETSLTFTTQNKDNEWVSKGEIWDHRLGLSPGQYYEVLLKGLTLFAPRITSVVWNGGLNDLQYHHQTMAYNEDAARKLSDQAQTAFEQKDYPRARNLAEQAKKRYPPELQVIDARVNHILLSVDTLEKEAQKALEEAESAFQASNWALASERAQQALEKSPALKGKVEGLQKRIEEQKAAQKREAKKDPPAQAPPVGGNKAGDLMKEASDALAKGDYATANTKAQQAAAANPKVQAEASALATRATSLARAESARTRQRKSEDQSAAAQRVPTGGAAPPPSGPTVYVVPAPVSQADQMASVSKLIDAMEKDRARSFRLIDAAASTLIRQIEFSNRWSQASRLDVTGESPEAMIARVEQKKQELERLSQNQKGELNREFDKLDREFKQQAAAENDARTAAIGQGITLLGRVVGTLSLDQAREQAKRNLDDQLTREFRSIQERSLATATEAEETALVAAGTSTIPEETNYFLAVAAYYGDYQSKLKNAFSITNTNWIYPSGRLPNRPVVPSKPTFTTATLGRFLDEKFSMASSGKTGATEAKSALMFLANYAVKSFPGLAEGYYYKAWLSEDVIETAVYARKAVSLRDEERFSTAAEIAREALGSALFTALDRSDTSFIKKAWGTGLLADVKNSQGDTPYIYAVRHEDPSGLETLLSLTPETLLPSIVQPLVVYAAASDCPQAFGPLAKVGANFANPDTPRGNTPLLAAASQGAVRSMTALVDTYHQDAAKALETAGATQNVVATYHLGRYLVLSGLKNDAPGVFRRALELAPDLPLSPFDARDTLLSSAVRSGKQKSLEAFLSKSDRGQSTDLSGRPLLLVAQEAKSEAAIFLALLGTGANPDLGDEQGRGLLHWAMANNRPELIGPAIKAGAAVNLRDKDGQTPALVACALAKPATITALLKVKPNLLLADNEGATVLHVAIKQPVGVLDQLIKAGADIDLGDRLGNSPLHQALLQKAEPAAEFLLDHSPDLVFTNKEGQIPLAVAIRQNSRLVARLVQESPLVDLPDLKGVTPLRLAVLGRSMETVDRLLKRGASLDTKDTEGNTVLHAVLSSGYPGYRPLLALPVNWQAPNAEGETPFHFLIRFGTETEALEVLARVPLQVDGRSLKNLGYVQEAVRQNQIELVRELARKGASVSAADTEFRNTSLHEAALRGEKELVRILLDAGASKHAKNKDHKKARDLTTDPALRKLLDDYREETNPVARSYTAVVRTAIDFRENASFTGRANPQDWGIAWAKTEAARESTFVGLAAPFLSGPGSYGKFYGVDLRLLYGGDAGTMSQSGVSTTTFGGIALAPLVFDAQRVTGGVFALGWAHAGEATGLMMGAVSEVDRGQLLQLGVVNRARSLSGVQIGFYNEADEVFGVQIGAINFTKTLKGFQIGILAWSDDHKFTIVNWGF